MPKILYKFICFSPGHINVLADHCCGAGDRADKKAPPALPRPVNVVRLEKIDPSAALRLTGTVESWKEENIGLRWGGRVTYVIDQGKMC